MKCLDRSRFTAIGIESTHRCYRRKYGGGSNFLFYVKIALWNGLLARNDPPSTGYWFDPADISRVLFTLFILLAIQIVPGPLPLATLQRVIYVCRVIVWSHTRSVISLERDRPLLESPRNCRSIRWIPRSFVNRKIERIVDVAKVTIFFSPHSRTRLLQLRSW